MSRTFFAFLSLFSLMNPESINKPVMLPLLTQGSTKGPSEGEIVDKASFEELLSEYYDSVGWDVRTGIPTKAKLEELGLSIATDEK